MGLAAPVMDGSHLKIQLLAADLDDLSVQHRTSLRFDFDPFI